MRGIAGEVGKMGLKGNQGNQGNAGDEGIQGPRGHSGSDPSRRLLIVYLFTILMFSISMFLAERRDNRIESNTDKIAASAKKIAETKVAVDYQDCLDGRRFVLKMNKFYDDMAKIERAPSDDVTRENIKTREKRAKVYERSKWTPIPDCTAMPKPQTTRPR